MICFESRRNFSQIIGNKGSAFGNGIMPYAGGTGEGPSQAEGPSPEGPLAIWHKPQLARTVSYSRYLTASRGPDASAVTCKKVPDGAFLVRSAKSDRNAHTALSRHHTPKESTALSRKYSDSRIPCRPSDTIENLFGFYPYNMAATRTIFAFIARAACRFESVHSRDSST